MYTENDINDLVKQIVLKLKTEEVSLVIENDNIIEIPDISAIDLNEEILVPNPRNLEQLKEMKKYSPARIAVYHAGPRYKTRTLLRFRADHAAAMDAVFSEVEEDFLKKLDLPIFKTCCDSKNEYLTRPDLGRKFDSNNLDGIKKMDSKKPQVIVYASDGLSSTAISSNIEDILPIIIEGLKNKGITVGKPFFVKFGRVPAMDPISEATGADVVCVLIGERPGLITAESMSAYITYKGTVDMPEARRTVISNIHNQGTPVVEAGAHIVDIIKLMLDNKASGLDLKM